ncbi:hypothetical protein OG339_47980 (plasmid) [Streptosporangium sp. NBC_01495]|uniref:hypothetical protein n=1 Tax=Streptosporangium sp. NBC_01495 TaxID=2903899 RepID=UPI002E30AC3F|nr:hypothetical protein [Streptosporangium sp. NBC_01495]
MTVQFTGNGSARHWRTPGFAPLRLPPRRPHGGEHSSTFGKFFVDTSVASISELIQQAGLASDDRVASTLTSLSPHLLKVITEEGDITTIEDLSRHDDGALLAITGFGPAALNKLKRALAAIAARGHSVGGASQPDASDDAITYYEITDEQGLLVDMTVGDLWRILGKQPRNAKVILASDAEENSYHPLHTVGVNTFYVAGSRNVDNEVYGKPQPGGVPCVLLTPSD